MPDRLRRFWDFDDLDGTEQRFREQLDREPDDAGRAEVLTQLARVQGLRGDFDGCERLLAEAEGLAGASGIAQVRIELERGRKLRSSGEAAASLPLFESAFENALASELYYLAGDAAHMVAIADAGRMTEWTERGLALAEDEPDAAYWAGPLLNNLGWQHFEAGDYEAALGAFERALEVRERDPTNADAIAFAREAVETARQALGR
ncbi:MAG: tetratricopeptide repeat protein [Actinobacteria bacterium]|nr:MAG: tetratricopeptide repeat protein [Actinomycetota bacterium]